MLLSTQRFSRFIEIITVALYAIAGWYVLYTYLLHLNIATHLPAADPYDAYGTHIKMIIFLCWLLLLLKGLEIYKKKMETKGKIVAIPVLLRFLFAGIIFCISVTGYNPPDIELSSYFIINTFGYAVIIYAFFCIPHSKHFCSIIGKHALSILKASSFYWVSLAFIFIVMIAHHLSWVFFRHVPWIDDTIVQLVHAKFVLDGHWYEQSPSFQKFFEMKWMINDGKWYSQYPPGHVFILAIGLFFNHPEMVNPILGASTCIAIWLLAKELYGAHVAKIAVLLTGLCSYLIIFSSEYMNNATSLLMCTLFLWSYFRVLNRHGWFYAVLAGATLGYCFITRPYSAFGFVIPSASYAIYLVITKPRTYLVPMVIMAQIFICFVLFQLYYNAITTGDAFIFGYQRLNGDKHNPFTQAAMDKLTPSRLYRILGMNLQRLSYFNRMFFEWPVPAMALLIPIFAVRGSRRNERLLFLTIFSMFISVQFIINADIGWGPRLVYEISGILLVLCAKSLSIMPPLLRKLSSQNHSLRFYYGASIAILISFYIGAFQYNLKISTLWDLYVFSGREGNPRFYYNIVRQVRPPALVFVPEAYYKYVSFTNPPRVTSPVIFAIDYGDKDPLLSNQYKGRSVYNVTDGSSGLVVKKVQIPNAKCESGGQL